MLYSFRLPDEEDVGIAALVTYFQAERAKVGDNSAVNTSTAIREAVRLVIRMLQTKSDVNTAETSKSQPDTPVYTAKTPKTPPQEPSETQESDVNTMFTRESAHETPTWDPLGGRPINPDPLEAATGGVSLEREAATGALSPDELAALLDGIV